MKIACIGWGSLIWNPGKLNLKTCWFHNGPSIPIEFTRISEDKRVTLIIDNHASPIQTLFAIMGICSIEEAKLSLMTREGITNPGFIKSIHRNNSQCDLISTSIIKWLNEKDIDAAIWTGLSYSKYTHKTRPTIQDIILHLNSLDASSKNRAEEYIRRAPIQIMTEYRKSIQDSLGWTPNCK